MSQARPADKSWNGKRLLALATLGWFALGAAFVLALYAVVPPLF
jgi:hypothetical protein